MALREEVINEFLGIHEAWELLEALMTKLLDADARLTLFERFIEAEPDLSYDWFTDYFQEGSSNRKKMMQDFTPKELTALLPKLLGDFNSCLDVCAGTGGLTIGAWVQNPNGVFYAQELSGQAFPLLLFNMAIRNMAGYAIREDVLSQQVARVFRLTRGNRFSNIEEVSGVELPAFDVCVTNPPYVKRFVLNELKSISKAKED